MKKGRQALCLHSRLVKAFKSPARVFPSYSHPTQSSGPENRLTDPLHPLPLPHLYPCQSFFLEFLLPSHHLPSPPPPFQAQAMPSLTTPGASSPGCVEMPGKASLSPWVPGNWTTRGPWKQILFSTKNKIEGVGYVLDPGHSSQETLQGNSCRHHKSRANATMNLCSHLLPSDGRQHPMEWVWRNHDLGSLRAHTPQSVHRVCGRIHATEPQMSPKNTISA